MRSSRLSGGAPWIVLSALLFVGCGDDGVEAATNQAAAPVSASSVESSVASTDETGARDSIPSTSTRLRTAGVLQTGGIGPVRFGDQPATAIGALTRMFGVPDTDESNGCARKLWFGQLLVWFDLRPPPPHLAKGSGAPGFSRWVLTSSRVANGRTDMLATDRSIGLGSTRSDVESAYGIQVSRDWASASVDGANVGFIFDTTTSPEWTLHSLSAETPRADPCGD